MKWITKLAFTWGTDKLRGLDYNPYPRTSILHWSRMAGSRGRPGSVILCYDPPSGRMRDFEIAWRSLPKRQRECIEVRFVYGSIVFDDGRVATKSQLASWYGVSVETLVTNVQRGTRRISHIIER